MYGIFSIRGPFRSDTGNEQFFLYSFVYFLLRSKKVRHLLLNVYSAVTVYSSAPTNTFISDYPVERNVVLYDTQRV